MLDSDEIVDDERTVSCSTGHDDFLEKNKKIQVRKHSSKRKSVQESDKSLLSERQDDLNTTLRESREISVRFSGEL